MVEYKILIDTNVFISAENHKETPQELAELLRILEENKHIICLHPSSLEDLERDKNEERKRIMKTKLGKYPQIENPPRLTQEFLSQIYPIRTENDRVDADLLYAVYKDCVDFLITNDSGIHSMAQKLGIADRVLSVESALDKFKRIYERKVPSPAPFIKREKPYNLDLNDPFFSDIKREYPSFEEWWRKISREGRDCWVYREDGKIGALLIYKEEEEEIPLIEGTLPKEKRVKICLLKVKSRGYRIGELYLKMVFEYCVKNDISKVYLTHFTRIDDPLVDLLSRFGFEKKGKSEKYRDDVYEKSLLPLDGETIRFHPREISWRYYPSFADSVRVKKFIAPILPEYHNRLFPDFPGRKQRGIDDYFPSRVRIPGNTIDKCYLSLSRIRQIRGGDILLFYRSREKELTALGVVLETLRSRNLAKIEDFTRERTVYMNSDIQEMVNRGNIMCIRFRFHFYLKPISLERLVKSKILKNAPQSITEISHENYLWIKKEGKIDERFTFY